MLKYSLIILLLVGCTSRQTKCLGIHNYAIEQGYAVEYIGKCEYYSSIYN